MEPERGHKRAQRGQRAASAERGEGESGGPGGTGPKAAGVAKAAGCGTAESGQSTANGQGRREPQWSFLCETGTVADSSLFSDPKGTRAVQSVSSGAHAIYSSAAEAARNYGIAV